MSNMPATCTGQEDLLDSAQMEQTIGARLVQADESHLGQASWQSLQRGLVASTCDWLGHFADPQAAAQAVCGRLILELWDRHTQQDRRWLPPTPRPASIPAELRDQLRPAAACLESLSLVEASYCVGLLYTELLPTEVRAARGAYYTPPQLAERLLNLAAGQGADWSKATVLDPACGGGAFLLPVAVRMLAQRRLRGASAEHRLAHLDRHLAGIEIDPFAAWLTRVFLQLLAHDLTQSAGRRLSVPLEVGDALELVLDGDRQFDLVIGNPPFGRTALDPRQRESFARSLFGHANLYGLFLDAALRWRKPAGLVAFLTPTSFLGGQYFSRLRSLLLTEAPPLVIDIVSDRSGVFPSVQQETCLSIFGTNASKTAMVNVVEPQADGLEIHRAGAFPLQSGGSWGAPWFLPRSRCQARLAESASAMRTRLETLGFRASTGPLVWNRAKDQLLSKPGPHAYPLVWAEAVRPNELRFEYRARADRQFVRVHRSQQHLLTTRPCVLVQRTTAKEQRRRLIACAVPKDFLAQWGAIVVENHVNVLWVSSPGHVSPAALAAVLNTLAVDEVFRCLSGSVAVSATELHALRLPPRAIFDEVDKLLANPLESQRAIEELVAEAYGSSWISLVA